MTDASHPIASHFAEARTLTMDADQVAAAVEAGLAPRRRPLRIVALIVPLIFAATATAIYISQRSSEQLAVSAINCAASNDGSVEAYTFLAPKDDPTAACATLWKRAEVDRTTTKVPPLTACADDANSLVTVFPSADPAVCERNNMRPMPANFTHAAQMTESLRAFLTNPGCLTLGQAEQRARRELDAAGLSDWTVRVGAAAPNAEPCSIVSARPEKKYIEVAALPLGSPTQDPQEKAWEAIYSAFRGSDGDSAGFCPDPKATIAAVRSAMAGGALRGKPLYLGRSGLNDLQLETGFTATLRCADISIDGDTWAITIQPEVPLHSAYPTTEQLRSEMPGATYGLQFEPKP